MYSVIAIDTVNVLTLTLRRALAIPAALALTVRLLAMSEATTVPRLASEQSALRCTDSQDMV